MYRAITSFTTKNYEVRKKQLLQDNFTSQDEIDEFLSIGYIQEYDGSLEITENGTYDVEDYQTAEVEVQSGNLTDEEYEEANDDVDDILEGSTPATIYPPDWSQIGYSNTPQSIIDSFNYAKDIYDNWDSTITDMTRKYINDTNLNYFPLVNTSNVTVMTQAFDTSDIQSIDAINTSKVLYFTQAFQSCNYLKDVPVFDFSSVTMANNLYRMFYQCNRLTNTSLNNIMASCITGTNIITGTKTLKYIGLKQAQAETCQTLSNYQAFLAAGWTTGY